MGNINKEAKVFDYGPQEVCIQMDKTKFHIGDRLTGNIVIHYNHVLNMACMIYIKVIGVEYAKYDYLKEGSTLYKYNIGPRKFFKSKKILVTNEILTDGYQDIQFTIEPPVRSPTIDFKSPNGILECKIEYKLVAKILWQQQGKRTIKQRAEQPIVFVKQFNREPDKEIEKIETLTTYKWFRTNRAPVFTYLNVHRTQITNDEHLTVDVAINNQYGNLNIKSAKLLFYLEFILKEKLFQGMPKYLIQQKDFEQLRKDELKDTVTFIIKKQDNIPHQSIGEKVGCRHIIVLQLIFEKQCCSVDDVEIIKQIEYYPSEDSILDPELQHQDPNLKHATIRHINGIENKEQSKVPFYIEESYFFDESTRLAHLTQIIEMK